MSRIPGLRAVLWDFGGVFSSSPFVAFARYEREHGLPKDFLRTINASNPDRNAWARLERSEISLSQFDLAFAEETAAMGHRVPGSDIARMLFGDIRPEMVEALKVCKTVFKTGCITNNVGDLGPGSVSAERAEQWRSVSALFDVVIESSQVGMRKPEPDIYLLACSKLQIRPDEAVYLDDLGINLKPAKALGMATIKVTEPAAALAELSAITGLTF